MAAIIPTRKDIREAIFEGLKSFPDVEELKPELVLIIENDVFAALPTGFGKSLTFQILPSVYKALFYRGFDMPSLPVVIVVSPLSSIVKDQVTYLRSHGFEAAFIGESAKQDNIFESKIKCHFLYGSPESFVGDIKFREMFSQQHYRQNVVAVVCDEVHTVVHW